MIGVEDVNNLIPPRQSYASWTSTSDPDTHFVVGGGRGGSFAKYTDVWSFREVICCVVYQL